MLQGVIDKIDAQINKKRSPLVNTLIATPIFLIVGLPLAIIGGTVVIIATGTAPSVAQTNAMPGVIAGAVILVLFWLWAAYGTYTSNKELQSN